MKLSKLFAGLSAAALAASAMSMVSFADDAPEETTPRSFGAYLMVGGAEGYGNWNLGDYAEGDAEITGDGQYTVSYKVPGDVKIGEELAVLTVQTNIAADFEGDYEEQPVTVAIDSVAFDGQEVDFDIAAAEEAEEGPSVWIEGGIRATVVNKWGHDLNALSAMPNGAEEVSVTFTVAGLDGEQFEYPDDAAFAAGGKSWGGVEFDSLKEVDFNAWDGIWWQLGVPTPEVAEGEEPTFTVDTSNAKAVVAIKFQEPVAADSLIFKYIDTNDGTPYSVSADRDYEAGEIFTYEFSYDDITATIAEETEKVWDYGFGANFQVAVPATVSSYLTGYVVTENTEPESESESESEAESESESEAESTADSTVDSKVDSKKAADSSSKAASTASTTNPGTGAAALAAVGVALAGAAVVTSKKRK